MACAFVLSFMPGRSQGSETFENFTPVTGTYVNGSFTGLDGSVWSFSQCRGDKSIDLPNPCLGKKRSPNSEVVSGVIHNGCGTVIFSYRQAFSTAVNLDLLINGMIVKNVLSAGGSADTAVLRSSDSITVNIPGDFTMAFRQADSINSGQVCIDNVCWTGFPGGVGEAGAPGSEPGISVSCPGGRRVFFRTGIPGNKTVEVYTLGGILARKEDFAGSQAALDMGGCPEGMYVAILRDKEKNRVAVVKLLLR